MQPTHMITSLNLVSSFVRKGYYAQFTDGETKAHEA